MISAVLFIDVVDEDRFLLFHLIHTTGHQLPLSPNYYLSLKNYPSTQQQHQRDNHKNMDLNFLTNVYALSPKPSFFELQACDQLSQALPQALDHIIKVFLLPKLAQFPSWQGFLRTSEFRFRLLERVVALLPRLLLAIVEWKLLRQARSSWVQRFFSIHVVPKEGRPRIFSPIGFRNDASGGEGQEGGTADVESPNLLQQLDVARRESVRPLPTLVITWLVFERVFLPMLSSWVESKLADVEPLRGPPADDVGGETETNPRRGAATRYYFSTMKRFLARLYPYLAVLAAIARTVTRLNYMLSVWDHWSVAHVLLNLTVRRDELVAGAASPDGGEGSSSTHSPSKPLSERVRALLAEQLGPGLFWAGIYALQLAQWYTGDETQAALEDKNINKIPAAPLERVLAAPFVPRRGVTASTDPHNSFKTVPVLQDKSLCGVCRRSRRNPAQSTGGFVFCYACLADWVREHKRCPVSGLPMRIEQVRRLQLCSSC